VILNHCTLETLQAVIDLAQALIKPGSPDGKAGPTSRDYSREEEEVTLPTPEQSALRDYLAALPHDVLVELQALYWTGGEPVPPEQLEGSLGQALAHSLTHDDRMADYLAEKNASLASALVRASVLLEPDPVTPGKVSKSL
jgi:hypothetical protein